MKPYIVPVYDYVLMTEPLSAEQRAAVGWHNRQGIGDSANQFHYYRLTADNRILWGGYDAVYHYGKRVRPAYDQRPETFEHAATHFFRRSRSWAASGSATGGGGAIDTCSRFCAFFGTAVRRRVAYAAGFPAWASARAGSPRTSCSTCSAARDRAHRARDGAQQAVCPSAEPVSYLGIQATRWSLARADRTAPAEPVAADARRARPGFDSLTRLAELVAKLAASRP
jgi:hypothetical protein